MTIQFKKATRQAVKLKIGLEGPAGSGKTEGALALAHGITNGGRVAVIDTENESASYYSDRYEFDTVSVPDAEARTLAGIITAAVDHGYDALVIDSLSHFWLAILAAKDQYQIDNPRANNWTAWGLPQFGPLWDKVMRHILNAPIHIVATMRSKQAHEQVEENGKKKVVKLGMQAQVRDGADYEFGLVFSVNMAHRAEATKDRTHLFEVGELVDLTDAKLHKRLIKWMNTETPATQEAVQRLLDLMKHPSVTPQAKEVITKGIASGMPGAERVAKWIAQLEQRVTGGSPNGDTGATTQPAPTTQAPALV
jgi:hypothetical protein